MYKFLVSPTFAAPSSTEKEWLKTVNVTCVVGRSLCLSADNTVIVTVGRSHAMPRLSVVLRVGGRQLMNVFMLESS